jgi:hypothetical protein
MASLENTGSDTGKALQTVADQGSTPKEKTVAGFDFLIDPGALFTRILEPIGKSFMKCPMGDVWPILSLSSFK